MSKPLRTLFHYSVAVLMRTKFGSPRCAASLVDGARPISAASAASRITGPPSARSALPERRMQIVLMCMRLALVMVSTRKGSHGSPARRCFVAASTRLLLTSGFAEEGTFRLTGFGAVGFAAGDSCGFGRLGTSVLLVSIEVISIALLTSSAAQPRRRGWNEQWQLCWSFLR